MAEGTLNENDQIAVLAATETLTKSGMFVTHIILTGTDAAASFVFTIGSTVLTIDTGSNDLSKVIPINRTIGYAKLTSGPTNCKLILFLRKG